MNDPNISNRFLTRQFHARWRHLAAVGAPLGLALGLAQLALAEVPIIVQQPSSQTVYVGATGIFRVRATTTDGSISFQWQRDDPTVAVTFTNIPNANRSSLALPNVTFEHSGDYRVIVANAAGESVTSDVARLEVLPVPFTKITEGPIVNDWLSTWFSYWGDYDNDGRMDVLVLGGIGQWRLYHNDGGTMFSTVSTGVMGQFGLRNLWGVWTDPDNDGDLDLLADSGGSTMYWNNGQGEFTRVASPDRWIRGPLPPGVMAGTAWGDFDRDGFLDCFSSSADTSSNTLLHNNGDLTFTWVSDSVLSLPADRIQLSAVVDYDNDGDLDLIPVRYGGRWTQFYRNDGQGNFEEATPEPIRSDFVRSLCSAWGDFDNDGDLDVLFGRWQGTQEKFYINNGDGTFNRWAGKPALFETYAAGIGSWEAWGDYDNDGFLDLAGGGGNEPSWLWRNGGDGNFTKMNAGDFSTESGGFIQSGCWVDFNQDGNLDLFLLALDGADKLFMGNGNGNHWLEVRPKGTASNRLAIGARIFATATIRGQVIRQMRVVTATDSEQTLIAHFGLGDATAIDALRIEWPSGIVQELKDVTADQILTVTEPPRLIPQAAGKLQIQCWVNQSFEVQCSSDLTTWTPVATVTNLTGTLVFEDVEADHHDCRYYRVIEARPNMVWIPPGTFTMGSPEDEVDRSENEGPQTQVTLTKGFWMGKYEVTQGEYLAVMGNNPSYFNGVQGETDYGTDLNRPVETVSWDDAVAYCAALTARERAAGRIPMSYEYRLPTEAEWEYACRAGTTTRFSYGDDQGQLTDYAWSGYDSGNQTHPVGQKLPNPWGLYDIHGNVWEWCQDWYGDYPGGILLDPQGPETGSNRVFRGGYWRILLDGDYAGFCRSALRGPQGPAGHVYIGFRVVLAPGQP